jgi:hypothetical protein
MHYYERNIAEIKIEYTDFFINMVAPLIYEGIKSIYMRAIETEKQYEEASNKNVSFKNPGVLKFFQHFLKGIPTLNVNLIESEVVRIRDSSKNADIFEKLIRAVFKSNIILLTYNASGKQCKIVNEKFHEKIDINSFIHKIYIECAIQFYNSPELFWDKYPISEIKKNKIESINIIKNCVREGIMKTLPLEQILVEYLKNDYIKDPIEDKQQKIRSLLMEEEIVKPILDPLDNGEEESNKLLNELNRNLSNVDALILNKYEEDYEEDREKDREKDKMNTEEEYNEKLKQLDNEINLFKKNKKDKKDKIEKIEKIENIEEKRLDESEDFKITKSNIIEDKLDKIDKIDSKEYYKAMFM